MPCIVQLFYQLLLRYKHTEPSIDHCFPLLIFADRTFSTATSYVQQWKANKDSAHSTMVLMPKLQQVSALLISGCIERSRLNDLIEATREGCLVAKEVIERSAFEYLQTRQCELIERPVNGASGDTEMKPM